MAKDNTCPSCGHEIIGASGISRKDNKTEICSECSIKEALSAFYNHDNKGEK